MLKVSTLYTTGECYMEMARDSHKKNTHRDPNVYKSTY